MSFNFTHLNILLIEDSEPDAFLITEFLDEAQDFNSILKHCRSLKEGLELLDKEKIDIVLIDYNLPDSNGINQMEQIFNKYNEVPFIVLTGLTDKMVSIDAINRGAKDYLVKGDFDSNLLNRAILYALQRIKLDQENVTKILVAQDKEKERIARDVHDTLGQNLTSAVLQIQNIRSLIKSEENEVIDSIEIALKCVNEAISESRGISRSLMPQTVQKFGLASGIESILMMLSNKSIDFEFDNKLEYIRFEPHKELALFRIAQESINNILKYSKAKNAKITLVADNKTLLMQIEDNGVGFDLNLHENQKGIGLESIRTRTKAIGAKLDISSALNYGTRIKITTDINTK
tara:strand:+ start:18442 stop:19482 length:1041 start_codon:yes stop_codon:yes gene_type:complete